MGEPRSRVWGAWSALLVMPISLVGTVLLRDGWLPGHVAECMLIWLAWSVAAFLVLRRLERSTFRRAGSFGVGFGLSYLSAGVSHDYALFGDTTWIHMAAAVVGVLVGMGAMEWALRRSDARRDDARRSVSHG